LLLFCGTVEDLVCVGEEAGLLKLVLIIIKAQQTLACEGFVHDVEVLAGAEQKSLVLLYLI